MGGQIAKAYAELIKQMWLSNNILHDPAEFQDGGWKIRPAVLRLSTAGLAGTDGVPAGRSARGFESDQEEAVRGGQGRKRPSGRPGGGRVVAKLSQAKLVDHRRHFPRLTQVYARLPGLLQ